MHLSKMDQHAACKTTHQTNKKFIMRTAGHRLAISNNVKSRNVTVLTKVWFIWPVIFQSYIFQFLLFGPSFSGPAFSIPAFSAPPSRWFQSQTFTISCWQSPSLIWILLTMSLCGGWCRRMALRNRELHARNDDDDADSLRPLWRRGVSCHIRAEDVRVILRGFQRCAISSLSLSLST